VRYRHLICTYRYRTFYKEHPIELQQTVGTVWYLVGQLNLDGRSVLLVPNPDPTRSAFKLLRYRTYSIQILGHKQNERLSNTVLNWLAISPGLIRFGSPLCPKFNVDLNLRLTGLLYSTVPTY